MTETEITMDISEAFRWDADHVMTTYARQRVEFVRGEGCWLVDTEGKRYLDLLAGIAVCSVGHSHPRLAAAIAAQAGTLIHASNLYLTRPQARLARRLVELSDFERVFFCNSGAEANEAAIKLARKFGRATRENKTKIVTALKSFHGRTLAAVTATGQPKYHEPFAPLPPGFAYVPFNDIVALEAAINEDTCAVLLEPIQGEGGIHPATPAYLQKARELCDRFGALLIFDEVQTGVGRTGRLWAYQQYGVVPDVMTLAKGLGGGVPIGACLARGIAAETLKPGDHGSTFAGNPLATAAANAVLDILADEALTDNAKWVGQKLWLGFQKLGEQFPALIGPPRGMGLMLGLEIRQPRAKEVVKRGLEHGLVLNATDDHTLRFVPPLTLSADEADEALVRLGHVLSELE
jgi:acetylornithine/N-succinyldiaminopimelate aminotransferase